MKVIIIFTLSFLILIGCGNEQNGQSINKNDFYVDPETDVIIPKEESIIEVIGDEINDIFSINTSKVQDLLLQKLVYNNNELFNRNIETTVHFNEESVLIACLDNNIYSSPIWMDEDEKRIWNENKNYIFQSFIESYFSLLDFYDYCHNFYFYMIDINQEVMLCFEIYSEDKFNVIVRDNQGLKHEIINIEEKYNEFVENDINVFEDFDFEKNYSNKYFISRVNNGESIIIPIYQQFFIDNYGLDYYEGNMERLAFYAVEDAAVLSYFDDWNEFITYSDSSEIVVNLKLDEYNYPYDYEIEELVSVFTKINSKTAPYIVLDFSSEYEMKYILINNKQKNYEECNNVDQYRFSGFY